MSLAFETTHGTLRPAARAARPGAVIGRDISAALALGGALGVPPLAMAELLPAIEAVMVRKLNEELAASCGPGVRS